MINLLQSSAFSIFSLIYVMQLCLFVFLFKTKLNFKLKYFAFSFIYFIISLSTFGLIYQKLNIEKNQFELVEYILLGTLELVYFVLSLSGHALYKMKEAVKYTEDLAHKKTMFTAMISHELRTPLNGIIGASQLIKSTPLNDEQNSYVNMMSDCGDALLVLINDVLDFSKLESNAFVLEKKEFDPQKIVVRLMEIMSPQALKKNIQLISYLDKKKYLVSSDETRLFQIVMNILSNAIKFTESGKVEVTQKWNVENNQLKLMIEISDTGIGMSEDTIKKLFNPFSQGDSSINRRFGGTGLGLVISKRILDLLGGQIQIRSYPNLGSTFYIDILFKEFKELSEINNHEIIKATDEMKNKQHESLEENKTQELIKLNIKTSSNNQNIQSMNVNQEIEKDSTNNNVNEKIKILICDDVAVNLLVLKKTIEKLGFQCTAVDSGFKVIEELKQNHFDLLFLDVQMPEMDGLQTATKIRNELQNLKLNIVALTANHSEEDRKNALNSGMNDFMSKPFKVEAIEKKVKEVMISLIDVNEKDNEKKVS